MRVYVCDKDLRNSALIEHTASQWPFYAAPLTRLALNEDIIWRHITRIFTHAARNEDPNLTARRCPDGCQIGGFG
jgi:hypothetical protein